MMTPHSQALCPREGYEEVIEEGMQVYCELMGEDSLEEDWALSHGHDVAWRDQWAAGGQKESENEAN